MDDRRFDALTRSLATGLSRRKVVKGLFGGAVLGGAAATGLDRAAAQTCPEGQFLCNGQCCPNANNCCGGVTCCPSSQCNQNAGICCQSFEFACGTGDNACCNTAEEKCCDGVCIAAGLCCPTLDDCPAGQTCCEGVCEDLQNDPTNCGACAADCSAGLLCCAGVCQECCDSEDCDPCERCIGGACAALLCDDPCEFCDVGVDACVAVCPENQFCCVFGPPTDATIECVTGNECCQDVDCGACGTCADGFCGQIIAVCSDGLVSCCIEDQPVCVECCEDSDCESCFHCDDGTCEPDTVLCADGVPCCIDDALICAECCLDSDCESCATCEAGVCVPLALPCPLGQVNCCINDELICAECCDDPDCGECEYCNEGSCDSCESGGLECCDGICTDEACCPRFGDECGLLEVTPAGGDWPPQLDCCDGLVCCEAEHGSVCAECCTDHECPKGWICCLGQCRELECCIDDILVGLDPNRRCPHGCPCFEGICDCHCQSNKDCASGACCCKDGTCSEHCCDKGCDHDKDCGSGACCCHDGSCSAKCCKTYTPPVSTLPGTGSGGDDNGGSNIAAAAFGAAAVYLTARKLRQQQPDEAGAEE